MPLTELVRFKTVLQSGNRLQVPKLVRWQFKMEPTQTLKVEVYALNMWSEWEFFYAKISKDGRILIPKLTLSLIGNGKDLVGRVFEVTLEPA